MTAALLIPVDGDVRQVDTTDDDIARIIGAQWFELLVNPAGGFMIAVDEEGLLTHRVVNLRATALARMFGRAYAVPLVGDALVLGVDAAGETVDVSLAGIAVLLDGVS